MTSTLTLLLNALWDACRKYNDQVQVFATANNHTQCLDESSMETMAITIKTRPNCKPLYDYDNPDDSPECKCQELAFNTAKHWLQTHIRKLLPDNRYSHILDSGTSTFALIQGKNHNLLYNATLLLTDETLYITFTETGQF